MNELFFEFTDNERDLRDAFEIRRQVFVREQNVKASSASGSPCSVADFVQVMRL